MIRIRLTTLALGVLAATLCSAQQYVATDVTPAGFDAAASSMSASSVFQIAGEVYARSDFTRPNAAIWGSDGSVINLHPAALFDLPVANGQGRSIVTGTTGLVQVGYGSGPNTFQQILAVEWNGAAGSATALPIPFASQQSEALGIGGSQIVGFANTLQSSGGRGTLHFFAGPPHALLWDSTTHAVIDLHNGAQGTVAVAANNGEQVGYGGTFPSTTANVLLDQPKAMLWRGSRDNFVWLQPPAGYLASEALATDGVQQAGWGQVNLGGGKQTTAPPIHAMVWANTAASFVDLNPSGFASSSALGVYGGKQVGFATDALGVSHAFVWFGNASSGVDLNQFLPAGISGAVATGIDPAGNISGYMFVGSQRRAIVWSPI